MQKQIERTLIDEYLKYSIKELACCSELNKEERIFLLKKIHKVKKPIARKIVRFSKYLEKSSEEVASSKLVESTKIFLLKVIYGLSESDEMLKQLEIAMQEKEQKKRVEVESSRIQLTAEEIEAGIASGKYCIMKEEDIILSKSKNEKFRNISLEQVIFNDNYTLDEKVYALTKVLNYSDKEANELLKTAEGEKKKAKLKEAKGLISKKALELYGTIPTDDARQPITDEVKMYVWQRDKGKCVKCGNQENIEYDHIIPFSKGGSNTARNIQILCQDCNRSKSNKII